MKSYKMNLKKGARSNFELFGISQERCKELCGLVDTIEEENPKWNITEVLEEASKQSENENENRFLIASYFQDHGVRAGAKIGEVMADVKTFFERATKNNREGSFLKSRSREEAYN